MIPKAVLRFDMMRAPFSRCDAGELYRAAIEMSAWADLRDVSLVGFSEHHVSECGFLASPFSMAAAVAFCREIRSGSGSSNLAILLGHTGDFCLGLLLATLCLCGLGRRALLFGVSFGLTAPLLLPGRFDRAHARAVFGISQLGRCGRLRMYGRPFSGADFRLGERPLGRGGGLSFLLSGDGAPSP